MSGISVYIFLYFYLLELTTNLKMVDTKYRVLYHSRDMDNNLVPVNKHWVPGQDDIIRYVHTMYLVSYWYRVWSQTGVMVIRYKMSGRTYFFTVGQTLCLKHYA